MLNHRQQQAKTSNMQSMSEGSTFNNNLWNYLNYKIKFES